MTTLVKEAVERLKIAFWASMTNANAGMKWLDHDSMEEMISAAWAGFEEPAMSALLASLPADDDDTVERVAFQAGVDAWMDACFTPAIKADIQERCDRFIEEALEFVQATGYTAERAHALVDYTFGRPPGEINQEVGGVMVTLAAACNILDVDIETAAQTELARIWTKIDTIRAKQAAKPTGSALP